MTFSFRSWGYCIFAICLSLQLSAQKMNLPDTFSYNFYAVLDTFFAQTPYDSSEGGIYHQMERLERRWGERLAPHGDFSFAANALTTYSDAFANGVACTQNGGNYNPNWSELGPFDTPSGGSGRGMGRIHRLAFNPFYNNGSQTVFAGTAFGGLFRSYDSGDHWHNVNTDIQLPIASVSGIAVVPSDTNTIIISTGDADQEHILLHLLLSIQEVNTLQILS